MEKTEDLRQNWHITEMQHNWKTRRLMAKKKYNDEIAKAREDKENTIKLLNEKHEAEKRHLNDAFDVKRLEIELRLNEELEDIARDQDDYMHRFRNYIASLPKEEQAAYNTREARE